MPTIAAITLFYAVDRWNEWWNALLFISDTSKYPMQLYLRELLVDVNKTLNNAYASSMALQTGMFGIQDAMNFYKVFSFIYHGQEDQDDYIYNFEQLIRKYASLDEILEHIKQLSASKAMTAPEEVKNMTTPEEVSGKGEDHSSESVRHETLQEILRYLEEHFNEDISLSSVSEKIYLNSCYLSQLFRKEVNKTFLQYLTEQRISYACKQLSESQLSIYEISEQSRYSNIFISQSYLRNRQAKHPLSTG